MRITPNWFILAFIVTTVHSRSTSAAEPEKHFEGPYHITTTAPKQIRATVRAAYRYPNLTAQEWMVAYPLPPEFDGQPAARARIAITEAPVAEPGRMSDDSGMRQPLATLHWIPDSIEGAHSFTVEATYDVTIARRSLESGEPARPVPRLTRAERSAFLAPSNHFDFTSTKFQAWLRKQELKRKSAERDLDFAHRAMETMVRTHTYRFELLSDRSASAVCKAGWSDCGGLATVYVSILRANDIPARCLSGRNLKPDGTHVRMDFYAEGVGWVPGDPSMAIAKRSADGGFGHERTDMVIMHFDLIRLLHQYCWLQGIGVVRSTNEEQGSAAGMTLEHVMTVEAKTGDDLPAAGPARQDRSKRRRPASTRRNGT
jgi:transglutaminase-like putative cysteine protease